MYAKCQGRERFVERCQEKDARPLCLVNKVHMLAWCGDEHWEMATGYQKNQRRHDEGDGAVHAKKYIKKKVRKTQR